MTDPTAVAEDPAITELDRMLLRRAIDVGRSAVAHGNHPFGAVLADPAGEVVLVAENSVNTDNDCTAHAETNLARLAFKVFGTEALAGYSLYTSCEPCAMCSGAIYWSGIGRVVWAMTEAQLAVLTGDHEENPTMALSSAAVLNAGQRAITVAGPAIWDEAIAAHADFWVR
ncbi:nucleoside deaminase [Microbacterium thalassium]|uniref:tRNA(Arg) A34 adenosine deaminase TadA n=1 Tax=Microbacterium thalassium TaxID=362649 RepID=A0A7X0KUF4_9MICO|nr:nucleoside deaminase [Microbacterium thalassium]MBB6391110.1 tRNA(Arg) A34 adenosine deaminase TadA [Microbacterium thalassium]GLK23780.1 tRNA-specific adenosine deaminase [Microbacterium thalassium]